jgi:predicted TPR repeat methyltransferase
MSSGNLTADRRFDYARMLQAEGDHAAAADVIAQAIALAPDWADARFAFAESLANAGDTAGAIQAYRDYLARDPEDSLGAAVRLALLEAIAPPARLPTAYVRRLFDQYAPRFDAALVDRLQYTAPGKLAAAVSSAAPGRVFAAAVDLGCGTGLSGAALRAHVASLTGVDLSAEMVAAARRKSIYDRLSVADIATFLADTPHSFDLIVAADVLVYVGALDDLFAAVRRRAMPDALFAFTLQRAERGFHLGADHRFSHSADYVRMTAAATGFTVLTLIDDVFRKEKNVDVPGLLCVLSPTPAPRP